MKQKIINYYVIIGILFITEQCTLPGSNGDIKKIYYEDGKTLRQSIEYNNGKKNGWMKEYYNSGILKAKQFYINDTLNDTSAFYFSDGRLKSFQFYKNKLKHGCWKEFNKEGKMYSEIFFKNGLLDSTSSVYTYRTGRLLTRVTYKEGLKDGLEERYYSNGKPQSKVYYDKGMPCLGTEEWLDNGKPINNDFNVTVSERNELLLNNTYSYFIHVEGLMENDHAYTVLPPAEGKRVDSFKSLTKTKDGFVLEYTVARGNYVMTKEYVAIFRKTVLNNTYIKIIPINVAINHY